MPWVDGRYGINAYDLLLLNTLYGALSVIEPRNILQHSYLPRNVQCEDGWSVSQPKCAPLSENPDRPCPIPWQYNLFVTEQRSLSIISNFQVLNISKIRFF